MASIIIGLDLGNDAIKAAVLKTSGRKVELLGIHHRRILAPSTDEDLLVPIQAPEPEVPVAPRVLTSSDYLTALASSDALRLPDSLRFDDLDEPKQPGLQVAQDELESPEIDDEIDPDEVPAIPPDGRFGGEVFQATEDLLRAIGESRASVIIAIAGELISTWMVELPFTDVRTIAKVLPNELATQVPFAMEDMVLDWRMLQSGPEGSRILAAQVPKDNVRELLGMMKALGVDPRHVCVDAFSLGQMLAHSGTAEEGCAAIIDLGRRRTLVNVSRAGSTLMVRTIDRGGDDVTLALAELNRVRVSEAEENKRLGVRVDDFSATGRAVAEAIDPLLASIRATLLSFEASGAGDINRIYLCGGGARIEGLTERFEEALGVPTTMLPRPAVFGRNDPDVPPEHALALSLAMAGVPKIGPPILDLRRGEFSYRRDTRRRQALVLFSLLAVVLFGVWTVLNFGVKRGKLAAETAGYENRIVELVKSAKPDVADDLVDTVSEAQAVLMEAVQGLTLGGPGIEKFAPQSPLVILQQLSEAIPKEITVDVDEYYVNDENIRLTCRTDSFEVADQLMSTLQKQQGFEQAVKGDQTRDRDGNTRFTITIPLPGQPQEGG